MLRRCSAILLCLMMSGLLAVLVLPYFPLQVSGKAPRATGDALFGRWESFLQRIPGFADIVWVGSTDLEVKFVISDAETNKGLAGAQISVESFDNYVVERGPQQIFLTTDNEGVARYVCKDALCSGRRNRLLFIDTWSVCLPNWRAAFSMDGYVPVEKFELWEQGLRGTRVGTGKSQLVIPLSLEKREEHSPAT